MRLVTVRIDGATRAGRLSGDEIVLLDAPDVRAVLAAGPVTAGRLPWPSRAARWPRMGLTSHR